MILLRLGLFSVLFEFERCFIRCWLLHLPRFSPLSYEPRWNAYLRLPFNRSMSGVLPGSRSTPRRTNQIRRSSQLLLQVRA